MENKYLEKIADFNGVAKVVEKGVSAVKRLNPRLVDMNSLNENIASAMAKFNNRGALGSALKTR